MGNTQEHLKRLEIAKAHGWWGNMQIIDGVPMGRPPLNNHEFREVPDYFNDLNAMHEAEKVLTPCQAQEYHDLLNCGQWPQPTPISEFVLHATASQRAECFLKVLKPLEPDHA